MEYHWYEDYWTMPRNLPKGHQFFIGYYQTQRAIRFHVENIHTDQSVFLSTWLLDNGYRVFLHFKSGIVTELKLGANPPPGGRINSQGVSLPFVASIVIGTIQLGATVDYAIVYTNRYLKAVNIEWDVDLAEDLDSLPKEVQIPDGMTDTEEISDYLSNLTGFCHRGFGLKET